MTDEKRQGAAVQTASADKTSTPPRIAYDDFHEAVTQVKACAAAMAALYLQDAGRITYDVELFEVLSGQLREAARYFDTVLATL